MKRFEVRWGKIMIFDEINKMENMLGKNIFLI